MRKLQLSIGVLLFTCFVVVSMAQQPAKSKATAHKGLRMSRRECAIFLPEPDERADTAKLLRGEQFAECERDGFPKSIAPPWSTEDEATTRLGDACDSFAEKSVRKFPQIPKTSVELARERCLLQVMSVILDRLIPR
jgi:hypothetical protein